MSSLETIARDRLETIIRPTLTWLGPSFAGARAEALLLAIMLHESGGTVRKQRHGSAVGLWQFEPIAIEDFVQRGELQLRTMIIRLGVLCEKDELWMALRWGADAVACVLARDLLWRRTGPLPPLASEKAYDAYLAAWRPGVRRPAAWRMDAAVAARVCGEKAKQPMTEKGA